MDKIKNYTIIGLSIALCITLFMLYCRPPKVVSETKTVESQYWKLQYTTLQQNFKSELAKNVHTVIVTHNTYDDEGHLADQTITNDTLDLSTLTESYNALSATLMSLQAKIKSLESITYAVYPLELSVGGSIDLAPFKINLLDHADLKYFWINNNMGSGLGYNWQLQKINMEYITLRF